MSDKPASAAIELTVSESLKWMYQKIQGRAYRASNELRNAALYVLRGTRTGRVYKLPATHGKRASKATKSMIKDYGHKLRGGQLYRASAPGEAPAVRTGAFRLSWGTRVHVEKNGKKFRAVSSIQSNTRAGKYLLGDLLENGTAKIAPRPYKQAVRDKALPNIKAIYKKAYKP